MEIDYFETQMPDEDVEKHMQQQRAKAEEERRLEELRAKRARRNFAFAGVYE